MVKVRLSQDDDTPKRPKSRTKVRKAKEDKPDSQEEPVIVEAEGDKAPDEPKGAVHVRPWRGMSERQWFVSLLVASGLLLLFTFRGCILPSGVGPKTEDSQTTRERTEQQQPQPTSKPENNEYTVQAGDTLGNIASRFDTTAQAIAEANDIEVTTTLRVGQKLKIP